MDTRNAWLPLALAAAFMTCACGDAEADEEVERVELPGRESETPETPPSDDEATPAQQGDLPARVARLGERDRETYATLVGELLSPCGDPTPVGTCAADESSSCRRCTPATHYVARLLDEGATADEIRTLYRRRYLGEPADVVEGESPVRGPLMNAPVTIIEFSDFECPHCGQAHPYLVRTLRRFEGRVRMLFKHYPLSFHQHAERASRATIAAGNQNKFWEMHDLCFENQTALTPADLERYARELNLDMERFRRDMEAPETAAAVARDRALGRELDIRGTPTIFINGVRFEDPLETLEDYVAEELEAFR